MVDEKYILFLVKNKYLPPARIAKQAFLQVFVILSLTRGGGGQHQRSTTSSLPSLARVKGHNTSPPCQSQRSQPPTRVKGHTSPPWVKGHNTSPPARVKGHNTSPLVKVKGHNTPPPSQGQRSQHLPLARVKGHNTPPSQGQRSQHLPPGQRSQHLPSTLCAGGRYASDWNAFLSHV